MTEHATMTAQDVFVTGTSEEKSTPIWLVSDAEPLSSRRDLGEAERRWLESVRFTSAAKKQAMVPSAAGDLAGVAFGSVTAARVNHRAPRNFSLASLPPHFPVAFITSPPAATMPASQPWHGGSAPTVPPLQNCELCRSLPRLKLPAGIDEHALMAEVDAIWLGRTSSTRLHPILVPPSSKPQSVPWARITAPP